MRIKKIYLRKRLRHLEWTQYLITSNLGMLNNQNTHRLVEPLFKGGSFIKVFIADNKNNILKIVTHNKIRPVCLFYKKKWYFGNYIKQKNLFQQNKTVLSLICKLKNKMA